MIAEGIESQLEYIHDAQGDWTHISALRTVTVCSHDDDCKNELQRTQREVELFICSYIHGHVLKLRQCVDEVGRKRQ